MGQGRHTLRSISDPVYPNIYGSCKTKYHYAPQPQSQIENSVRLKFSKIQLPHY